MAIPRKRKKGKRARRRRPLKNTKTKLYSNRREKRPRRHKRDFEDPKYIEWRKSVYERDNFKCRICGKGDEIEAHHIKMWSKHPDRRFIVGNGITLCKKHHKMTLGFEERYEAMFFRILTYEQ